MSAPFQMLPPLTPDEFAALRQDIFKNGVAQAVLTDEFGNIIDGHHRAAIAEELGVDYEVEVIASLSDDAKRDLALRLNVHRRSLSREQKRELLARSIKSDPHLSDRQHAERAGVDHKTAGAARAGLESTGEIPQFDERQSADGKTRPAHVTSTTRTTETTKVEHDLDLDTGEVTADQPEPEPSIITQEDHDFWNGLADEAIESGWIAEKERRQPFVIAAVGLRNAAEEITKTGTDPEYLGVNIPDIALDVIPAIEAARDWLNAYLSAVTFRKATA